MLSEINKLVGRTSAFTFLFYPTSEFDGFSWQFADLDSNKALLFEFLNSIKIPSCVSPFHDKDIDSVDVLTGVTILKKPHYHVVIDFGSGSNKSVSQFFDLILPIRNYVGLPALDRFEDMSDLEHIQIDVRIFKLNNMVKNMRSLLRYFKHLDHPDKYQYIDEDYHTFCGFELENRIYSQEDSLSMVKDIIQFVNREEMYLFCDLVDYCIENNSEWFNVVSKNTYNQFIVQYMKSKVYYDSGKLDRDLQTN